GLVGLPVDPVHVPAAPQGFAGQGEGGHGLAAAGFADDERLAAPDVERRRHHWPPRTQPPVPDPALQGDAEDGATLRFRPWPGAADGASGLGAVASGLAEVAVVAGGFLV